jgi:hypothetical protein
MATKEEIARGIKPSGNGKKRGSVDNASRLAAFSTGGTTSKFDWGGCDPRWVQAIVVQITSLGGAITFGTSRDGGAASVTLLLDGDRQTLWFNGDVDLDAELEKIYATLETMT